MIPHNRPTLGFPEIQATQHVLESGWVAQGPEVASFEQDICEYLGIDNGHAVALSSGTAALFMALWALGARGKRVAIPAYSCAALNNAVTMCGGIPEPMDVDVDSPNIDLKKAISGGADIAVLAHMFGIPRDLDATLLAIPVVEDCAQALGTRLNGRPVGLSGTIGIFSFYATKMITSGGQGGMLVSRDKGLVEAVRDFREFDCRHDRNPRFNFQMTDLHAAVGRAQLARLGYFRLRRDEIYERYSVAGLPLWPDMLPTTVEPNRYRALIRSSSPDQTISRLAENHIRAICPIEDWELLGDAKYFPRAHALSRTLVSLPIYPSLALDDVKRIAEVAMDA